MNLREAERLLRALREVRAGGGRAAMATVVRVHGSAYRREGARMLVRPDGTYECALSGGCLEPAVADAASRVIATGEPSLVTYDLADDSVWGLNIGCSGAVDIRIERVEDDAVTERWFRALGHGEAAVLVTPLDGTTGRRLVLGDGATLGALPNETMNREADDRARRRLSGALPESGLERVGTVDLFFEVNQAAPALVVFGAGLDAAPLARQAIDLGFSVTVADPREASLRAAIFPGARLVQWHADGAGSESVLPEGAFAIVMNHHLDRDRLALGACLGSRAAYIGVLGPRARFERLLADLRGEGVNALPSALARVHSPIGLAIGAETPEEVALSILAEILAVRRGFEGGSLSGSGQPIHRPAATRAHARS